MHHKLIALLPMKAVSQRVPGKNFKLFAGRPLYQWVLDTLLQNDAVERIIINTDAEHLLESSGIVRDQKILIRNRRPELCGNSVSMNHIIADDLEHVSSKTYLMTHTTNPLMSDETVRGALQAYEQALPSGYDSLFSVNRYQTRFYKKDGEPINHDPDHLIQNNRLKRCA